VQNRTENNIKNSDVILGYVTVVFDLASESESQFTMYPNPDSLIEYPHQPQITLKLRQPIAVAESGLVN